MTDEGDERSVQSIHNTLQSHTSSSCFDSPNLSMSTMTSADLSVSIPYYVYSFDCPSSCSPTDVSCGNECSTECSTDVSSCPSLSRGDHIAASFKELLEESRSQSILTDSPNSLSGNTTQISPNSLSENPTQMSPNSLSGNSASVNGLLQTKPPRYVSPVISPHSFDTSRSISAFKSSNDGTARIHPGPPLMYRNNTGPSSPVTSPGFWTETIYSNSLPRGRSSAGSRSMIRDVIVPGEIPKESHCSVTPRTSGENSSESSSLEKRRLRCKSAYSVEAEVNGFAFDNPALFRKTSSTIDNNFSSKNEAQRSSSQSRNLDGDKRLSMTTIDIAVKGRTSSSSSRLRRKSMSQEWIVLTMTTTDEETVLIPSAANKQVSPTIDNLSDRPTHSLNVADSLTNINSQDADECFEDGRSSSVLSSYESIFSDSLNSTTKLEYKHFLKMQQDNKDQQENNTLTSNQENAENKARQVFTDDREDSKNTQSSCEYKDNHSNSNENRLLNSKISDPIVGTCDLTEHAISSDVIETELDVTPLNVKQGIAKWEALSHGTNKRDLSRTERRSGSASLSTSTEVEKHDSEKHDSTTSSAGTNIVQCTFRANNIETRVDDNDVITKVCTRDNDVIAKTCARENEINTKEYVLYNDVIDVRLTTTDINQQIVYTGNTTKIITKQIERKSPDRFKVNGKIEKDVIETKSNSTLERKSLKRDSDDLSQTSSYNNDDVFQDEVFKQSSTEEMLYKINDNENSFEHIFDPLKLTKMVDQKSPLYTVPVLDETRDTLPVADNRVSRVYLTFRHQNESTVTPLSFSEIIIPAKTLRAHTSHTLRSYTCTQYKEIEVVPGGRATMFRTQLDLPSRFLWTSFLDNNHPEIIRSSIKIPPRPVSVEFILEVPEVRTVIVSTYELPARCKLIDLNAITPIPTTSLKPTCYSSTLNVVLIKSNQSEVYQHSVQLSLKESNELKFSEFVDYNQDDEFFEESAEAFSDIDNLWMRKNDILVGFATLQPVEQLSGLSCAKKSVITRSEPVYDSSTNITQRVETDIVFNKLSNTAFCSVNDEINKNTIDCLDITTSSSSKAVITTTTMSELVTLSKHDRHLVNNYATSNKLDCVSVTDCINTPSADIATIGDSIPRTKPQAFGVESSLSHHLDFAPEFSESNNNIETVEINSETSNVVNYISVIEEHEHSHTAENTIKTIEEHLYTDSIKQLCESNVLKTSSNEHRFSCDLQLFDTRAEEHRALVVECSEPVLNIVQEKELDENVIYSATILTDTDHGLISITNHNNFITTKEAEIDDQQYAKATVNDSDLISIENEATLCMQQDKHDIRKGDNTFDKTDHSFREISHVSKQTYSCDDASTRGIQSESAVSVADDDSVFLDYSTEFNQTTDITETTTIQMCVNESVLNSETYDISIKPICTDTVSEAIDKSNVMIKYAPYYSDNDRLVLTTELSPTNSDTLRSFPIVTEEAYGVFPDTSETYYDVCDTNQVELATGLIKSVPLNGSIYENNFSLPESSRTSETETTEESWEEMYSEHTVETRATRVTSRATKVTSANDSKVNPSLSGISENKSEDVITTENTLTVPQFSVETPSVRKLNKTELGRKTSEEDDEWSSSETVVHTRYLFDQSTGVDRVANNRKESTLLDENVKVKCPRDVNKRKDLDESSSYRRDWEESSTYSRSVIITSTENLSITSGSDVIVHQYAEMYSFFTQPPVSAADAVLRSILLRHQNNYAVRRLLVEYPALRPSTWAWSTNHEIDSYDQWGDQTEPCFHFQSRVSNKNNSGKHQTNTKSLEISSNRDDQVTQEFSIKFEPLMERFTLVESMAGEIST